MEPANLNSQHLLEYRYLFTGVILEKAIVLNMQWFQIFVFIHTGIDSKTLQYGGVRETVLYSLN